MLVLDWFLFDTKSKALRGNPLEIFLKEADLDEETKLLYRNFRQGKFGLFEVKAIRTGKGMLLIDLSDGKEYQVSDVSASKTVQRGQCCFFRMLPFEDYFILTGVGYPFPAPSTPELRLIAKNMRESGRTGHLSPLQVFEIMFAAPGAGTPGSARGCRKGLLPDRDRSQLFGSDQPSVDAVTLITGGRRFLIKDWAGLRSNSWRLIIGPLGKWRGFSNSISVIW